MTIKTDMLVSMTDANQNFSKVVKIVDEKKMAVIVKNNKPKYLLVDFEEYEQYESYKNERLNKIKESSEKILLKHLEAFKELAK